MPDEQSWLPPGSATEMRRNPPAELIRPETVQDDKWRFGRLLFRSPSILGEKAVRIGLSCNSCHTNGHMNSDFFISGLSDRPGRVDVTHRFWQAGFDDGVSNPLDIPSLRGSRDNAPYGSAKIFPNLASFTNHVIVTEFAGPKPSKRILEALIVYMESLDSGGSAQEVNASEVSYLPLLLGPLETKNLEELDELYELIRSDYGRRAAKEGGAIEKFRRTVVMLGVIRKKAAAGDFAAAITGYQNLVEAQ